MPMRQLRTCDFCGAEAAGVYEVLPPELSPTEAEQRRVVLCADCSGTLEGVLEPLLSRLGVDRGSDSETEKSTPTAEKSPISREAPASEDETASDEPPSKPSPAGAGAPDAEADAGSDGADSDAIGSADAAASAIESDAPRTADSSEESGEPERFGPPEGYTDLAESDEVEVTGLYGDPESDAETNGVDDSGRDRTVPTDDSADETASSAGRGAAGEEPEDFRTVMRLLGNREFPVRRSDVVELAGSAYDLDDANVERIIDHAIDRGVLAEDDGTLRKA